MELGVEMRDLADVVCEHHQKCYRQVFLPNSFTRIFFCYNLSKRRSHCVSAKHANICGRYKMIRIDLQQYFV
jgi:hypothetical protein